MSFENTVGKGEIARNEQFLLFPRCFLPVLKTFCHFLQIWNCRLQTLSVWKSLKFVVRRLSLEIHVLFTYYRSVNRLFRIWVELWCSGKTLIYQSEGPMFDTWPGQDIPQTLCVSDPTRSKLAWNSVHFFTPGTLKNQAALFEEDPGASTSWISLYRIRSL